MKPSGSTSSEVVFFNFILKEPCINFTKDLRLTVCPEFNHVYAIIPADTIVGNPHAFLHPFDRYKATLALVIFKHVMCQVELCKMSIYDKPKLFIVPPRVIFYIEGMCEVFIVLPHVR